MLAPAFIDDLQDQEALERTNQLLAELLLARLVLLDRGLGDLLGQVATVDRLRVEIVLVKLDGEELSERGEQAIEVPVLHVITRRVLLDCALDRIDDLFARLLAHLLAFQHLVAVSVDDAPLLAHHVVVLKHALSDQEVLFLHLLLSLLNLLGEHASLDRLLVALLVHPTQAVEDLVDAVAREQPHEVVLGREEEATLPGIALATRAPAQLVVDAPRLVALSAADEHDSLTHHG